MILNIKRYINTLKPLVFIHFILINPIILYILTTIVSIFLLIYFADVSLCDDGTVTGELGDSNNTESLISDSDLRLKYDKEVTAYRIACEDHKQWSSIARQATRSPSAQLLKESSSITGIELDRIYRLEDKLYDRISISMNYLRACTRTMRVTEAEIKKLNPNFNSLIGKQWFELTTSEALALRAIR